MKNKIYIESFGYQKVSLIEIENLDELFIAEFSYKKNKYYGIIDKNGKFVSDIYVPEFDLLYNSRMYNTDNNFKVFNLFSDSVRQRLKDNYITDRLESMFNDLYEENDMTISHTPAKIIKFPGGSNEKK